MKNQMLLVILTVLGAGISVEAQILKNLAKRAEKAAEQTILNRADSETEKATDRALDSVLGVGGSNAGGKDGNVDYNTAKMINTDLKRSFYTHDVVIRTVNQKDETGEHYFDAEELALRGISSKSENPIYIDSEAFQYGYNEHEGRWQKTGLMRTDAMSFMMPMLSIGMVKLPPEPMLEAVDRFKEQGMKLNTFLIVEWAFIYEPDDFRMEGYREQSVPCKDGGNCAAFYYEDPDYEGTYVQFDSSGRLSKIYAHVDNQHTQEEGTFDFFYDEPVAVRIPQAVEVKMPMQDILFKGLDVDDN